MVQSTKTKAKLSFFALLKTSILFLKNKTAYWRHVAFIKWLLLPP